MRTLHALTFALVVVTSVCASVQADDIDKLVAQLKDKHPRKAAEAAQALAALGKAAEPAIPDLIEALADDRAASQIVMPAGAPTVASYASAALVAIGASATENLILELRDSRETVRELAMQTLGGIGQPASASLPELKAAATQEEQPGLRMAALAAYLRIDPDKREIVALLTHALIDASPDVRGFAALGLGEIGAAASPAVPLLVRRLRDQEYRTHWISNHFATERLVRLDACEALGKIGVSSKNVIDALTYRMTRDEDPEVRVGAALALLRLDNSNRDAMNALIAALESRSGGIAASEAAAHALEQLGPLARPAFAALKKTLKHRSEFTRMAAVRAIAAIGDEKAVAALVPMLDDEDAQVRADAAECLGELGTLSASAVPRLTLALQDDSVDAYFVCCSAAEALGKIGPAAQTAVADLRKLAESSKYETLREIAAKAIKRIEAGPTTTCLPP